MEGVSFKKLNLLKLLSADLLKFLNFNRMVKLTKNQKKKVLKSLIYESFLKLQMPYRLSIID